VLLGASLALAADKKTAVLAVGDCADPSLVSASKDLRDALAPLLKERLVEGEVVLDIVRPRATRSLADIQRQLDSARTLFYGGQAARAEELVDRSLDELDRVSPTARPWQTTVGALTLKALIARGSDRTKDVSDALRRVLRVDPDHVLDPDAVPPGVLTVFENLRRDLQRAKKTALVVRPETGTATVFVDGRELGEAPQTLQLVPGSYRVSLAKDGAVSFPHKVEVPRDAKLAVDLAFEGSVGLQAPLCLSGATEAQALRLGQLVAVERVIVLRNLAPLNEPAFLSGAVFDLESGKQEREGSVQPELVATLAKFLVTGQDARELQHGPSPVRPKVSEKKLVLSPTASADPSVSSPPPPPPPAPPLSTARVLSWSLIGAGAAAIAGGIITFASASDLRTRFEGITQNDVLPSYTTRAGLDAIELMPKLDANRAITFALIGTGVGAIAGGIFGLVLFPASGPGNAKVSVQVGPEGGAVRLSGSF